jgi:protein ImuB
VSEHRPERAWRSVEPGTLPAPILPPAGARPLWLLDAPRELGSIRRLKLLSGPERIESGWWDGADIRRDYYVAHAQEAGLWWIFRSLDAPERWYVHGYFG